MMDSLEGVTIVQDMYCTRKESSVWKWYIRYDGNEYQSGITFDYGCYEHALDAANVFVGELRKPRSTNEYRVIPIS